MKQHRWMLYTALLILMFGLSTGCSSDSETQDMEISTPSENEEQLSEEMGERLSGLYVDMMNGDEYLMKYRTSIDMEGQIMEMEATVAVSGENTAMISSADGIESMMIMKDGKSYVVDHENRMVLVLSDVSDPEDSSFNESTGIVDTEGLSYLNSGKEDGLVFEEYSSFDGTIRYYFDDDKFVKLVVTASGQTITMEILEMTDKVPEAIFEVPSDYQMITM